VGGCCFRTWIETGIQLKMNDLRWVEGVVTSGNGLRYVHGECWLEVHKTVEVTDFCTYALRSDKSRLMVVLMSRACHINSHLDILLKGNSTHLLL
jgi:hypothetical protein